jgi:hypothetical protein
MPHSPLDEKALGAIAILMDRRGMWSVITYGDLAARLGHVPHGLGPILHRVHVWCGSVGKLSLAMLAINEEGRPSEGMFDGDDADPITPQNYEQRRVKLWREDWRDIRLPTLDEIAKLV